ncbi:Uncharacterised protein [Salmonella enterica subsp. enterica serovar Bovismorbificans]|uniref:Uncharacterized protein n=1 Tax=Salmonella enterica subsp. enterica serovar Bovismorbificans TaxID=58097 RepID=A0A655EAE2_SALET|nr:Uncharacterised protein [Salmonella enterica subsp. enterica serovar Bovismorbificans]CNU42747.1 Uncharacterised protein [Salmonella enterica subsp. enterica serovar Bovismorbificans]CNV12065.1 Uncharacterised protein [Salmonella enterica subsp. enterica serovar Bovismorbificans]CNV14805.1 Uncharacterised protein [Salmonella enterica subsp. enterica serovar Bovismorbificans]CQB65836.1 Uncharacterised protein [Salmonella enterica subsp. enterica serovar Bovismorbificans]
MRRGVGQHGKAVAEYTRFTEYRGGLSTAHLLECAVQLGGSPHIKAGVQLVVGVTGVQRLRHVAYRAVGRHIGIGVFSHGDVNVAVGILATLGVPDYAGGSDVVRALDIAAGEGVIHHHGGIRRTAGKAGIHLHVVANHQVIGFQRTGATVGVGANNIVGELLRRVGIRWRRRDAALGRGGSRIRNDDVRCPVMVVLRTRSTRRVDVAAAVAQQVDFAVVDDGFGLAAKRIRVIRVNVDHAVCGVVYGGGITVALDADKPGAIGAVLLALLGTDVDGAAIDQVNDITAGAAANRHGVIALHVDSALVAEVIAAAQID